VLDTATKQATPAVAKAIRPIIPPSRTTKLACQEHNTTNRTGRRNLPD
jgi:hypothetical protein